MFSFPSAFLYPIAGRICRLKHEEGVLFLHVCMERLWVLQLLWCECPPPFWWLSAIKIVCQLMDELPISENGQVPTQSHWTGAGKMAPQTWLHIGAASHGVSLAFNLLRRTAPETFVRMDFTNREEHQEREHPTQHVYSPTSTQSSSPCLSSPGQAGSPSALSLRHRWDCLSRGWSLPFRC